MSRLLLDSFYTLFDTISIKIPISPEVNIAKLSPGFAKCITNARDTATAAPVSCNLVLSFGRNVIEVLSNSVEIGVSVLFVKFNTLTKKAVGREI